MAETNLTPATPIVVSPLRHEAARRLGFRLENLDPDSGYLFALSDGRRSRVLVHGPSPLNDAGACHLAGDKYFTGVALQRAGFRVPAGVRCLAEGAFEEATYPAYTGLAAAEAFAEAHGFPLVVKPNRGSRGRDVALVQDRQELAEAVHRVWKQDYLALVQERISGSDLRLDFLDGEYLLGYTRQGIHLRGDGQSSLRELFAATDRRFQGESLLQRLEGDRHWREQVEARGWDLETIPPAAAEIPLSDDILNLNRLCVARLVAALPQAWLDHALGLGQVLHLRHFGVDFKLPMVEPDLSIDPAQSVVLEVNASPSLRQTYERGESEAAIQAEMRVLTAILEDGTPLDR
jgi:glutathione synthase/RimK-type ligase-like ATP-grasp enzyme